MLEQDGRPDAEPSQRAIRPLLLATVVSVSGDGALNIAAPLLAASITSDPLAVALVTVAEYLPWILIGLPAGALVDRWPKRTLMVWIALSQATVVALFCGLMAIGQGALVALVITVLLVNAGECFYSPASQSTIPAIIGKDQDALRRANGRYLAVDGVGRALVGPLGGAWLFTVGRVLPFVADAVSFAFASAVLRRLPEVPPAPGPHEPVLIAVRTGFRKLYRVRTLFILAIGLAVYNVGHFAVIATFALYTRDILHVNEIAYGALFAVLATAVIITGWVGTGLIRGLPDTYVSAGSLGLAGAAWLVASINPNYWITAVAFAAVGVTAVLGSTTINSAAQRLAPAGSLGRITSFVWLFAFAGSGIGALLGGWVADGWGLAAPLVVAGVIQVTAGLAVWLVCRDRQTPRPRCLSGG